MAKAVSRKARARKKSSGSYWIIGGVVVAAVLMLALVWINLNAAPAQPPKLSEGRTLGLASAPVTIDEYADFQCPICGRAKQVIRAIAANYIETGKVKVVYHNFAFIGPESEWAAQAAECANDQGKYWDYNYYLFDHQTGENVGAFSRDNLKRFATELKLDRGAFDACFDGGKYVELVQKETADARTRGIQATPSFYINGRFYEGLLPEGQLTALINSILPAQ
jgi:protein-disulfide isomerase